MSNYTYSYTTDFNGAINPSVLYDAVLTSTIDYVLDDIDVNDIANDNITLRFRGSLTSVHKTTLDGLVAAHDGRLDNKPTTPVELKMPTDDSGILRVRPDHMLVDEDFLRQGYHFTAGPNGTSFYDIKVSTQIYLKSGEVWVESIDGFGGDYLELSVIDKDNVTGAMPLYGLTPGQDILELRKFVQREYIPPRQGDGYRLHVNPGTVANLAPGLYIRISYTNLDKQKGRLVVGSLEWYERT